MKWPPLGFSLLVLLLASCGKPKLSMPVDSNPLPACPDSPNCVRTQVIIPVDSSSAFTLAKEVFEEMNAMTIEIDSSSASIKTVFKIPVFGWLDDMTVIVVGDSDQCTIYLRSASRIGYFDLWVNKIRVRKFIRILNQKISE